MHLYFMASQQSAPLFYGNFNNFLKVLERNGRRVPAVRLLLSRALVPGEAARLTVASLHRYPVKSCGGERLAAATLTEEGIDGDRRYLREIAEEFPEMIYVNDVNLKRIQGHKRSCAEDLGELERGCHLHGGALDREGATGRGLQGARGLARRGLRAKLQQGARLLLDVALVACSRADDGAGGPVPHLDDGGVLPRRVGQGNTVSAIRSSRDMQALGLEPPLSPASGLGFRPRCILVAHGVDLEEER